MDEDSKNDIGEQEEIEEEPDPWWKGPARYIIAVFLVLMMVAWIVPAYSVRIDPNPGRIPAIEEVMPENIVIGNESNDGGVEDFRKFVTPMDPGIRQAAAKIATISCDGSRVCQAKALYYFVRDNIEYVADPIGQEYLEYGAELMRSGGGDCESGSLLLASLEEAIGIDAQLVLISGHAYLRIYLPEALKRYKMGDGWVYLDWTCKKCGFGEVPWKNIGKRASYMEVP